MDQLIMLIVWIIVFGIVAYGLNYVCIAYNLPQPIRWICGGVLIIILLLFLSHQLGIGGGSVFRRPL